MLWQIGLGDSVNNITDAVIRAVYEDCHFEKKDLFFQQAEKVSPYIETAFTYLNTKHVNNKKIEVNVLCRYAEIFQELLHPSNIDTKEKKELCDFVLDTLVHYLSQIDLRSGLSKKEYIGRLLQMEILNGEFGQKAAENFKKIRKANQFSLALSLSKMYYAGSSVNQFRLVTVRIFPLCSIYRNKLDTNEIYVHIPYEGDEEDHACMEFIIDTFIPLGMVCRVFWKEHFGVLDVDNTMVLDNIAMF